MSGARARMPFGGGDAGPVGRDRRHGHCGTGRQGFHAAGRRTPRRLNGCVGVGAADALLLAMTAASLSSGLICRTIPPAPAALRPPAKDRMSGLDPCAAPIHGHTAACVNAETQMRSSFGFGAFGEGVVLLVDATWRRPSRIAASEVLLCIWWAFPTTTEAPVHQETRKANGCKRRDREIHPAGQPPPTPCPGKNDPGQRCQHQGRGQPGQHEEASAGSWREPEWRNASVVLGQRLPREHPDADAKPDVKARCQSQGPSCRICCGDLRPLVAGANRRDRHVDDGGSV